MPRKDTVNSSYHSKNDRSMANRSRVDSDIPSFGYNDIKDAVKSSGIPEWVDNGIDLWSGQQSYSDFVSRYNQLTDGYYSTFANGIPGLSNLHNALLGRDSAKDYLENNNLSWKDMEGYNDVKLLGRTNAALSGLAHQSGTYLSNIGNDLGKLYSGQNSKINFKGYHSNMMDSW